VQVSIRLVFAFAAPFAGVTTCGPLRSLLHSLLTDSRMFHRGCFDPTRPLTVSLVRDVGVSPPTLVPIGLDFVPEVTL